MLAGGITEVAAGGPVNAQNDPDKPRGRVAAATMGALAGAFLSAVATWLVSQGAAGENVDLGEAEVFIRNYYETAVDDPEAAWQLLTDRLQDRHEGGYDEFRTFWADWSRVDHRRVTPLPNTRNYFTLDVAYVTQDGEQQSYRPIQFGLTCDDWWANRMDFVMCEADQLRLHHSLNPTDPA
jgi:hypothetical protein